MIELSNELKQKIENLEKEKKELEQKINIVESQKNSVNNDHTRMVKYYKKYKDLKKDIESKEEEFNVEEPQEEEYENIEEPEEEEYENIEESDEEEASDEEIKRRYRRTYEKI